MGLDSLSDIMIQKEDIVKSFQALQDDICDSLEKLDGTGKFREDNWNRPEGGGGRSRAIANGNVLEKGGVNFSAVHGPTPEKILQALKLENADFFATGVSIVLHPVNPHVPIIHMNIRYFEMSNGTYWFGGGIDLTPHYVSDDDARFFHQSLQSTCDRFDKAYYPKFKSWADEYFYLPHRNETRGIGGIFFDRLKGDNEEEKEQLFEFTLEVGKTFIPTYSELVMRNNHKAFSEDEKRWQQLRRGRYVEFNLVHDKGTKFGLDTGGRTESILMSMPPTAGWQYDHSPEAGSRELATLHKLRKGIDWINA